MLSTATRRARPRFALLTVAASLLAFTGCASSATPQISSPPPTMAPVQSLAEACGLTLGEIDEILADIQTEIDTAISAATSGQMPDFNALFDPVRGSLARISGEISNSELRTAIDNLRLEIDGFGKLAAPDSLRDTARYISDLTSQAGSLYSSGTALRQLCVES